MDTTQKTKKKRAERVSNEKCIVRNCSNTKINSPEKLFVRVPQTESRQAWLDAVQCDLTRYSKTTKIYVCGDHFNIENDMENFVYWKIMGGNKIIKPGILPHKFQCWETTQHNSVENNAAASTSKSNIQEEFAIAPASNSNQNNKSPSSGAAFKELEVTRSQDLCSESLTTPLTLCISGADTRNIDEGNMETDIGFPLSARKKQILIKSLRESSQNSGIKCLFTNCKKTCRDEANIQFFCIPRDPEVAKQWIINSGNLKLLNVLDILPADQQLLEFVCWNHFQDDDIKTTASRCLVLRKDAVPKSSSTCNIQEGTDQLKPYIVLKEYHIEKNVKNKNILIENPADGSVTVKTKKGDGIVKEIKTEEDNGIIEEIKSEEDNGIIEEIKTEEPCPKYEGFSEENVQLEIVKADIADHDYCLLLNENTIKEGDFTTTLDKFNKKRKRKLTQHSIQLRKRRKVSNNSKSSINRQQILLKTILKYKSKASKAVTTMQLLNRRKNQWNKDEKDLAMGLFYKSPSTYNFLQEQKVTLPSTATIRNWITNVDIKPGLCPAVLSQIKRKVSTMKNQEKSCMVVFSEINISYSLKRRQDGTFEGFQDFETLESNESIIGTDILVLVLKGLYSNWNLPLAYFVTEKETCKVMVSKLLELSVKEAMDTGLEVCGVLSDLDCKSKYLAVLEVLGLTEDKPYFVVQNKKIFGFLNIFSLFEMIKDEWSLNDFLFCGNQISIQNVVTVLKKTDTSSSSKTLPALFSQSPLSILNQTGKNGGMNMNNDETTHSAEFVKYLSVFYEILNKKDFELTGFLQVMKKILTKFKNGVFKVTHNGNEELLVFHDLCTLINAIILFCNEYQPKKHPNFVLNSSASRFTKELFSINDPDCTLQTFRNQFRETFVNNMMKAPNEND